jgi:putative oxidoreductase
MNLITVTARASYPVAINLVLLIVRLYLGPTIFTHGYRKVFRGGKLAGTAGWFDSIGMRPGQLNAVMASTTEMGVGVLLALGVLTPFACAGLLALMMVAVVTVHRKNGFMITNRGGGMEYCLGLSVMALALGTLDAGRYSLDHVWKIFGEWTSTTDLVVTLAVGLGGAALQLLAFYRPPSEA